MREKEIFVQTAASLIDDTLSSHICDFAKKGRKLEVTGFDKILPDGTVRRYKVKRGESNAWIFGKYTVLTEEEAALRYGEFDEAHKAKCQAKLDVLMEQNVDLCTAIDQLMECYKKGEKVMKVYKQMKMYNDPALNPVLYGQK